ncbi:hypothetical protein BGO18_00945 [Candidatus Saccharibacteria bacterium 47-87]|nr:hypothetical protein [Candidatus Saccharibacteria bacterium]OJU96734.1 MAG: hypothetical protein BGO18_00945 [Candidatus Saccharibacteria bacterium 47-87]
MVGKNRKQGTVFLSAAIGAFLVVLAAPVAYAYTATEYPTTTSWTVGTVVAVNGDGSPVAASTQAANYIGVVANPSTGKTVEVAGTGTVSVVVTDKDGAVESGTRLGLSSVAGVASAWTNGTVIGVAQEAPKEWKQATLDSSASIKLASVRVQLLSDGASSGSSPINQFFAALEKTASGVAGKPVDTWRIITALLIGLGGLILAFGLLFISSRESFFSMGRNPMASKIIMRGLWKMVALSVGILCITLTASYLIVRIA